MVMKRRAGAAFVDVAGVRRRSGAEWKLCDFVRRWTGSAWVDVWRGITAGVSGYFSPTNVGGGNYYDQGTFSVYVQPSGTPTPTAYQWDFTDYGGGVTVVGSTTGNTIKLRGPGYNINNFPQQNTIEIWCNVTIGGTVYRSQSLWSDYQSSIM